MTKLVFTWNYYAACWECTLPEEKIYIHKYPPMHTLVSIHRNNYIRADHEVFDALHTAQHYIGLKYNAQVKYRDPNEEKHPRKDLLDIYI